MIDIRKLIDARVQFGHLTSRWYPKMREYIWGVKNKVHLINVAKTAHQLEKATQFIESVAAQGKQILWVGTKRPAQDIIEQVGLSLKMPYVNHRWVGGTLSNFGQVKKSVTKLLHLEDVLAKAEKYPHYTKKELSEIQKQVDRLKTNVGGIKQLTWPVGALVIVDVTKEQASLLEAFKMGIPVIALVDTNGDPSLVDYVIPANDDSPRSIKVIIDYLEEATRRGMEKAAEQGATAASSEQENLFDEGVSSVAVLELTGEESSDESGKSRSKVATLSRGKPLARKPDDRSSDSRKPKMKK